MPNPSEDPKPRELTEAQKKIIDSLITVKPIVRIPKSQLWAWSERTDRLLAEAMADQSPKVRVTEPGAMESKRPMNSEDME